MSAGQAQSGQDTVLTIADLAAGEVQRLADRFELQVLSVADTDAIPGTFWGEPEAGIIGNQIYVRDDTPVHSLLHEMSHIICMDADRRAALERNAGGDDAEESAVCYLQIVLADEMPGVGRERLMQDMDTWGYSFRLGSTSAWFCEDATDASAWLQAHALLTDDLRPAFRLRGC